MQNLDTTDELSIANQTVRHLQEKGVNVTLVNFGVGSFQTTLESIKFQDILRRVPKNERPEMAIFYDGYNDSALAFMFGAGAMQGDLSAKLEALVSQNYKELLIYSFDKMMAQYSKYWQRFIAPRITKKFSLRRERKELESMENIHKAVEMYEMNTRMIRAICKEFDITPVFLLQPMIHTKEELTKFEQEALMALNERMLVSFKQFYAQIRDKMCIYQDFYDLSDILDSSRRNDFYDYGHTGPYTGTTIGAAIADIIFAELSPDRIQEQVH